MFDLTVDKSHLGGGFIGRTLLINADKRHHSNSMIREVVEVDYEKLAAPLKELSKLQGPMTWSPEAMDFYDSWFYPYREADIDDKTGTHDRLNDHVIKIAACISLSRKKDMVIEEEDVDEAITVCTTLPDTARKVAGMQGKSETSTLIKSFLMIMFQAPEYTLTRKQVLQKGFGDFDSAELDKLIETLNQTGFVAQLTGGKEIKYKLTKICVDWWEKTVKGKKL